MRSSADQAPIFNGIPKEYPYSWSVQKLLTILANKFLYNQFVAGKAKAKPAVKPAVKPAAAAASKPEESHGKEGHKEQEEAEEEDTKEDDPALEDDGQGSESKNVD